MLLNTIVLILYFLTFLLLPVVITQKKRPSSAIAWIMAILFLPFMGAFLYLLVGTERITNKGKQKLATNLKLRKKLADLKDSWASKNLPSESTELSEGIRDIMRISSKLSLFAPVCNNEVKILVDAEETYQKMEDAITGAQHHISLEYYIFYPDKVGTRFRDLLAEKARQGVKVYFLYDAIGSHKLGWSHKFLEGFRNANIEPRDFLPIRTFFKPWNINLRNHRKILIVDNNIGFTGGINVGEDFLNKDGKRWRDTHIMIKGPAVIQLQWVFFEDWYFATGEDLSSHDYFLPVDSNGNYMAQVVPSGPDESGEAIQKVFFTAIAKAKKSVYLTTPYFIPDQTINTALQITAMRGIDVKLLLPEKSDHRFVLLAGRSYYDDLLECGVKIFEYMKGIIHAKMLVVDGEVVVIGSANVDMRSFSYSFEVNVNVYGREFASAAENVFLADLENSRELTPEKFFKRPSYVRFGENFCRLFSSLL
ncbi:MAG: cardiolipin synthase [Thermodesulfobacteriota bacterium]